MPTETKPTQKYISDCCDTDPKGGLWFDKGLLGSGEGLRNGKCSTCDELTTFHINPDYVPPTEG